MCPLQENTEISFENSSARGGCLSCLRGIQCNDSTESAWACQTAVKDCSIWKADTKSNKEWKGRHAIDKTVMKNITKMEIFITEVFEPQWTY